jgi:predicted PurR-regulated permease PerM
VSDAPPPDERATVVMGLDWRSVVVALVAFLVLVAITGVIRAAPRTLTWLTIGGLLALALNPLVGIVERRLHCRRGVAVTSVAAAFVAMVAALIVLFGPPASRQARNFSDDLPQVVNQLGDLPLVGDQLRENDVPQKVQDFIDELPSRLSGDTAPIKNAARSILGGFLAATATLLITVSLLLDADRLLRGARQAVPERHRQRADRIGEVFYRIVGRYFAGSLLVAVVAGLGVLMVGLILGVPLTPLLAVWVALFDLVPQIGGAAGGIPFVLLAFTQGATTGVIVAIYFLLYLQFEDHILQPLIVGEAVELSPPATMVAALVGVSAAGVPGALVAVPLLGVGKAIYVELREGERPARRRRMLFWRRFRRRRAT